MDRRTFLTWSALGALGSVAGCTSDPARDVAGSSSPTESPTVTPSDNRSPADDSTDVTVVAGVELPLPKGKLSRGAPKDAIPAITDPAFAADWSGVDADPLQPDDRVIGVERGDEVRAYPLRILNWHEIANDTFDDPLVVSFCPLCGSALVAKRIVDGQATIFGVSGLLWNSDLVMYDRLTESLWSQIAATAVRGPKTGTTLELVPSSLTTWQSWRDTHPETEVLLPSPASKTVSGEVTRDYDVNPYSGYESSSRIGIGRNDGVPDSDAGLHPKAQVLGIASRGVAKAYPLEAVLAAGVVNDTVGDLPVVVAVAADEATLVGYVRRAGGATLSFERASDTHLRADGSRWGLTTGRAVDGPHAGTNLEPAAREPQMFWFAWLDFHPDTEVYSN